MELAVCNGFEQQRKPLHQFGGTCTPRGSVLRKAKLVDAVGVQARARPGAVQPACVDFRQMCEQGREYLIRSSDQLACLGKQLAIRKMSQPRVATRSQLNDEILPRRAHVHAVILHPRISTAVVALWRAFDDRMPFRINERCNAHHVSPAASASHILARAAFASPCVGRITSRGIARLYGKSRERWQPGTEQTFAWPVFVRNCLRQPQSRLTVIGAAVLLVAVSSDFEIHGQDERK
jgi:hypothetical protein